MKKLLLLLSLLFLSGCSNQVGVTRTFVSNQVGESPAAGRVLQTNGATSTWVTTSSLGIAGGAGGGITDLNGETGTTQTFATGTATGIGLLISSGSDTHTFTPTVSTNYSIPLTASTTDWQTAYGWGDHALGGYLTSYTETDPIWTSASTSYLRLDGGTMTGGLNLVNATSTGYFVSRTTTIQGGFFQTDLADCNDDTSAIMYNSTSGKFECGDDDTGAGSQSLTNTLVAFGDASNQITSSSLFSFNTTTGALLAPSVSSTNVTTTNLSVSGALALPANSIIDAMVAGTLTLTGGSIDNMAIGASTPSTGIFSNATSTNFFSTGLSFTNGNGTSITSTNGNITTFTFGTAVGTSVTTTNIFSNGSSDLTSTTIRATTSDGSSNGVGILDSAGTTVARINSDGDLIGNLTGSAVQLGGLAVDRTYGGLWIGQTSPSVSNFSLLGYSQQTIINAPNSGIADIEFRVGNGTRASVGNSGLAVGIAGNTAPTYPFQVRTTPSDFTVLSTGLVGVNTTTASSSLFFLASTTPRGGIFFGETGLYRSAVNTLKTDGDFLFSNGTSTNFNSTGLTFTNLSGSNVTTTNFSFTRAVGTSVTTTNLSVTTGLTLPAAGVIYSEIQNVAGLSVFGRSANSAGVGADITGTAGQVLRVSGTTLGFGAVDLSTAASITGVLPIINGGTGASSSMSMSYMRIVTTTGSTTWTKPTSTRFNGILVWCVGGGGGGGGTATASRVGGGGGGGGGAFRNLSASDLSATSSVNITVGAAGTGGAAGNNDGVAGGTSSFGTFITCTGGGGGNDGGSGSSGGAGGVGSGGNVNGNGRAGTDSGLYTDSYRGYGGAAAANQGDPTSIQDSISNPMPAAGILGMWAGAGPAKVPNWSNASYTGGNGSKFGGGGGGGQEGSASADAAGGNGAQGVVVIIEQFQ